MRSALAAVGAVLAASPLACLTLTVGAYLLGAWLHRRARGHPLVNPVLIAIALTASLLTLTATPYPAYFEGAKLIHTLLGPATVALAVPLYRQIHHLRRAWPALVAALGLGSLAAILSAALCARLFGAPAAVTLALLPKSATAPIAIGIAQEIGGPPTLTAVLVILTGITGAVIGSGVLRAAGVRDPRAIGFAIGLASHGIGTARAFQLGETAGAFAGLAMGANGLATALLVPLLVAWLV